MMTDLNFKDLFSIVNTPLLVIDHKLIIVAANEAYMNATGIRESTSVGHSIFEIFPSNPHDSTGTGPADLKVSLQKVLDTAKMDEMPIVKYDIPVRNSSTGEFEERYWKPFNTPLLDSRGHVTHILHRVDDVTDFMRAENKNLKMQRSQNEQVQAFKEFEKSQNRYRESQEQLQFALESAKMGTWHIDLKTHIVTTSKGAAKIWGLDEIKADIFEVIAQRIHPEDQARVNKAWTEAVANHTPYYADYRIFKPDGKMIWGFSKGETQFDADGKPVALMGVLGDMTERKEAQLKLETAYKQTEQEAIRADRERAKFEAAFHAVAEGIFIFNSEGRPVFMNDGAAKVFGSKSAADVTKDFAYFFERLDLYEMDDTFIPLTEWPVARVLRGESFRDWQIKAHRRDTNDRWIWSSSGELATQTGSDISLAVVVLRDITAQIAAEKELIEAKGEAERANELKSAFLANMSHEIRTPLGAILGFSSLLKDKHQKAEEKDKYINTIIRNGNALTKIIDDILDLAKVEAGKLDIENVPFSLYALATDAVDLFKDKTKEKDIYLVLNIDDAVPTKISSDPTRLRQILVNLIGNAVKFTDKGGIRVNVRSQPVNEDRVKIIIDVRDTGIGMEPDQREKLFKPFTQADNSMTRKFGGTGLGLALSQRLSKALAGEITISECTPGEGSTFTFTFTAHLTKNISTHPAQKTPQHESHSLKGLRVLVVEDSQDNQFLVERLLTKNGAMVVTASDGQEGFNRAMKESFDVVLMDIQMPIMDGYQAKQALDQKGYNKPVIALTAHAMSDERIKTAAAGFAAHLTKPLVAADLLKTVANAGTGLH